MALPRLTPGVEVGKGHIPQMENFIPANTPEMFRNILEHSGNIPEYSGNSFLLI